MHNMVYDEYLDTRNFVDKLWKRFPEMKKYHLSRYFLLVLVFFAVALLWFAMSYYGKPKIENDAFDYRYEA